MQQNPPSDQSIIPGAEAMAPRSDNKEEVEDPNAAAKNGSEEEAAELPEAFQEDDAEAAELARLRCESVRTEEKRQQGNRANRSLDYPGLAFGSAMFGSDTMMKFNIIKNELHNIMRSQLKRVDGEVSAMAQRIKALDDNLALSEQYIKTATATLAEAVQHEREHDPGGGEGEDSALSQFDAQMALLGHRLLHAKMLAAEACGENEEKSRSPPLSRRPATLQTPQPESSPQSSLPSPTQPEASSLTPHSSMPDVSSQNCLLSAPPAPAPVPLRRPFSVGRNPKQ